MSKYRISPLSGEVVLTGHTIKTNSPVFTSDGVGALELAEKYHKTITAKVGDKYVGWGSPMAFCRYKFHKEKEIDISEVTFWHPHVTAEFCKWHQMLLFALQQPIPFDWTENDYKYYTRYRGEEVLRSEPMEVKFKSLYDKKGFKIKY
jgi:hypothetical protein